jgi:hypothetical protein
LLANEDPAPLIGVPAACAGAAISTPATTAAEAAIEMILLNIFLLVYLIYRLFDDFILGTFC